MSKNMQNPGARSGDAIRLATLGGVAALLVVSFSNWRSIDRIQSSLDTRLVQVESRLGEIAAKVEQASNKPAQQAPPQRGPDPNRVYDIKTAGAPSKGPLSASVTIAEFSDFQ